MVARVILLKISRMTLRETLCSDLAGAFLLVSLRDPTPLSKVRVRQLGVVRGRHTSIKNKQVAHYTYWPKGSRPLKDMKPSLNEKRRVRVWRCRSKKSPAFVIQTHYDSCPCS